MSFFQAFANFAGKGMKRKVSGADRGFPQQTLKDLSALRQFREIQNSPDRLSGARKLALADAKTARLLLKQLPAPAVLPSLEKSKLTPAQQRGQTNFKTSFGLAAKPSPRALLGVPALHAE